MATNIDKGLYSAPQGLDQLAGAEPSLEIEIEDPESVSIDDGGMEVTLEPEPETIETFDANLAEYLSEEILQEIATDLMEDYQNDVNSRKDWLDTYVDGLELLGMKLEERTEPWEGACAVYHPLMTEALVKFQAETMMETFPAAGPVKTQIIGKQTKEKEEASMRVKEDMNYQLTEKMTEYRAEHERMLWGLGLAGNAFKKVYYDPSLERQISIFVPAEDVVVPYGASNLDSANRVTHVMRKTENELRKLQVSGFYRDIELDKPTNNMDEVEKKIAEKMGFDATADDRYKLLEMHVDIDIPGLEDSDEDGHPTGIALPYVVTLESGSGEVLAVRRNWNEDDKTKQKRQHFVHYGYVPGFGFYCFGMIHLIGAFAKSGTMLLRQLVDAGTLSNLPGGFKTRGLRIQGDETPIAPGEFRDVDIPSGTMRDNILPLPYKEPSVVLQNLMNQIIDEGRRFANAADLQVSDMSANSPVGTTLAILERTLKVMSAVQARIHYAMRQEFKLLKGIIRDFTPETYSYDPEEGDRKAKKSDYDSVDVIPVSDPNAATMSQKVVQYQAVMQMAQGAPQIYDLPELHKQMLEVLGVKNIGKLIPAVDNQKPKDPVTENMNLINGVPVKAFIHQDHEAHIAVHMSAIQDPKMASIIGQNPQAQQIMGAAMAHINEHIAFAYRRQIEEQLGVPLPAPDEVLPDDVEVNVSRLAAAAAKQLLQKNQSEVAQQQAQQQAQDPIIQMQQKELELKAEDIRLKEERLKLDKEKLDSAERIAGAKLGADVVMHDKDLNARQMAEGTRMGIQAVQNKENNAIQRKKNEDSAELQRQQIEANKQQAKQKPSGAKDK